MYVYLERAALYLNLHLYRSFWLTYRNHTARRPKSRRAYLPSDSPQRFAFEPSCLQVSRVLIPDLSPGLLYGKVGVAASQPRCELDTYVIEETGALDSNLKTEFQSSQSYH